MKDLTRYQKDQMTDEEIEDYEIEQKSLIQLYPRIIKRI